MKSTPFVGLLLVTLILASNSAKAEEWLCTEAASVKQGDSVLVCGVATADDEGDAREQALQRAQREFQLLCNGSDDCRGRPTSVEPLRNSCEKTSDGKVQCYRGLRYSFMDNDSGVFGRSTPVTAGGGKRPDVIKPFTIGVGYYNQTYNVTNKDAAVEELPLLTDNYGGIAAFATLAFNHRYGINANGYWLSNSDSTRQNKSGIDAQFVVGTNLNQSGFKAFMGAGGFYELWNNGSDSHSFVGGEFVFGLGYNSRTATYDFLVNMRQTRAYDDFAFDGDLSGKSSSAGGAMFRWGLRF